MAKAAVLVVDEAAAVVRVVLLMLRVHSFSVDTALALAEQNYNGNCLAHFEGCGSYVGGVVLWLGRLMWLFRLITRKVIPKVAEIATVYMLRIVAITGMLFGKLGGS